MNDYMNKADEILSRLESPTKESFLRLFKADTNCA